MEGLSRKTVAPDAFIPIIERLGLMASFTYSLLRRACLDARGWPEHLTIGLNISPTHLSDPLMPVKLLAVLSETDFPPRRLEIEVTETAVANDADAAIGAIAILRDLGIKAALDDFGTGYSSLQKLHQFQFDKIKIDRSFVQTMSTDMVSRKLVHSILELAKHLGLTTIAEGVEREEDASALAANGANVGQGYLFGKAMPAADANALVDTYRRETTAKLAVNA